MFWLGKTVRTCVRSGLAGVYLVWFERRKKIPEFFAQNHPLLAPHKGEGENSPMFKRVVSSMLAIAAVFLLTGTQVKAQNPLAGLVQFRVDCLTTGGYTQTGPCQGDQGIQQITDTFTFGGLLGPDGGGNTCYLGFSTGTLSTADGSTITYHTTGVDCFGDAGYNPRVSSLQITGGTKRFAGASGVATFTNAPAVGGYFIFHIDGNIRLPH